MSCGVQRPPCASGPRPRPRQLAPTLQGASHLSRCRPLRHSAAGIDWDDSPCVCRGSALPAALPRTCERLGATNCARGEPLRVRSAAIFAMRGACAHAASHCWAASPDTECPGAPWQAVACSRSGQCIGHSQMAESVLLTAIKRTPKRGQRSITTRRAAQRRLH